MFSALSFSIPEVGGDPKKKAGRGASWWEREVPRSRQRGPEDGIGGETPPGGPHSRQGAGLDPATLRDRAVTPPRTTASGELASVGGACRAARGHLFP